MPKVRNTIKQRKETLYKRITPEYLESNTSVFKDPIGEAPLDRRTLEIIKTNYRRYFNSWARAEAEIFLLGKK